MLTNGVKVTLTKSLIRVTTESIHTSLIHSSILNWPAFSVIRLKHTTFPDNSDRYVKLQRDVKFAE